MTIDVPQASPLPGPEQPPAELAAPNSAAPDPVVSTRRPTLQRVRIPAGLLSCLLHLLVLLGLALAWRVSPRGGGGADGERSVQLVTVRARGGERAYVWDGQTTDSAQSSESSSHREASVADGESSSASPRPESSALAAPNASALALPGVLPAEGAAAAGGAAGQLPSPSSLLGGRLAGASGSGAASTRVFGVEGNGTRFVYVFDRSGSMAGFGGRPLLAAKDQLVRSLHDLGSAQQFQIIFYNEQAQLFDPEGTGGGRLLFADSHNKRLAEQYVGGVVASGRTEHLPALMLALSTNPDVIFFLTDADEPQLSPGELERVTRRNQRVGAVIHTIEFGAGADRGDENFLTRLASANRGRHVYINLSRLTVRP